MKNNLAFFMNKNNLNQKQIREELKKKGREMDPAYLSRIISGKQKPSFMLAFGLAYILGCRVDDLFNPTKGEMFNGSSK